MRRGATTPGPPGRRGPRKAAKRGPRAPGPPGPAWPPAPSSGAKKPAGSRPQSSLSGGGGCATPAATPTARAMAAAVRAMRLRFTSGDSFSVRALVGGSLSGPGAPTLAALPTVKPLAARFPARRRRTKASCYRRRVSAAPRLAELPWSEVDALDRDRAVCILPVGAVEAHGPHLPLATDGIIAGAMAEDAAARLAERDLLPLLLPAFEYTSARFAAGFSGTLSVKAETVTAALVAIGRSLAFHGFRTLALANA